MMVGLFILGEIANAGQHNQAATAEAWRTSLSAFVMEVGAVAEKSEIPNATVAITHIRETRIFSNAKGEDLWVVFKQGFDNEFHGELAKRFAGQVLWRGVVESVRTDAEKKVHFIEVKYPLSTNLPKGIKFEDFLRLSIPISKLPAAKLPSKGSDFAFRGNLKKEKADAPFEPVCVWYGLGPNAGKVVVGVNLVDVESLNPTK
jgi:hypothetical protein